jgi:hypothetical protein
MSASTNPTQVSVGHDLIAGYRSIADSMSSSGRDSPTPETDSAILSAAWGNSRRRRARPARYAAIAAGVAAAVGLALITASRHPAAVALPASAEWENRGEHGAASALPLTIPAPMLPHGRSSTNGLDSLVFSASPADTGLRTAAEVRSGSEIQTTTRTATGFDAQHDSIDLNQPGALERLARENPFHYAIIRRILAGVDEVPEHAVSRWMKSQFNATEVTYSAVLMTSAPPRKQLSFTLETTRYSVVLTLTPDGARVFSTRP